MRVTERILLVLLAASLGCAADAYQLGALGDEGSGGGSDDTADGTGTDGEGPFVDPLVGASPLKVYQDQGMVGVTGGLWDSAGSRLLVADTAADAVLRLSPGVTATHLTPAGGPRGLAQDPDGALVVAQTTDSRIVRVLPDDSVEILAEQVDGSPLGEPYALVVTDSGTRYATDASRGLVLRLQPDGAVDSVASGLQQPQGITVDAARERLLVAERSTGRVVAYSIEPDGSLTDTGTLVTASAPLMGLCIDDESNVYAVGDAGLEIFAPDGNEWGTVASPDPLTDCSFGRSGPQVILLLMSPTVVHGIDLLVDGPP